MCESTKRKKPKDEGEGGGPSTKHVSFFFAVVFFVLSYIRVFVILFSESDFN